ncbi:MAG: TrbC family F-type conjugative pilus assembly protein [Arcobacteraceae bacterium]|jgi:type-F conjugative transfer system pilin assembly protein TrbC|nr:TrbC family F-type conjugative pilus assembly protein [Arcobacteraceae bacterium]
MKRILFNLTAILVTNSFCVDDINESKIFLDKYNSGVKEYNKEIKTINYNTNDVSVSQFEKDINVSSAVNTDAKNIIQNRLIDNAIDEIAKKDADVVYTDKFKKQFREAKDNLLYDKKLNWSEQATIAQKYLGNANEKNDKNFYFNSHKTIYIFISSSIEETTLKNYLETTKYIQDNVVFVLQGAIGGMKKLRPTMQWIKNLITDKYANARIVIDPRLAKNFGIQRVPAILYTQKELFELEAEKITNNPKSSGDTYLFYGDMPFRYTIKELNEKKQNQFLTDILRKLDTK